MIKDINFIKWYSGMDESKIRSAYERYLKEVQPVTAKTEQEIESIVTIPKWQMVAIEDVLRQTNNIHHSQKKETCFDRCVCKAWKWTCDALGKEYSFEPVVEQEKPSESAEEILYKKYIPLTFPTGHALSNRKFYIEEAVIEAMEEYASQKHLPTDCCPKEFAEWMVEFVVNHYNAYCVIGTKGSFDTLDELYKYWLTNVKDK